MRKEITTLDGIKISYELRRSAKNKNWAVLLHGLTGSGSAYKKITDLLFRNGFNVIVPDLRSHGFSGGDGNNLSLELFRSDLTEIINKEDLKTFSLVGHCFGSLLAFDFANKNSNLIDKLVLISLPISYERGFKENFLKHAGSLANLNIKKLALRKLNQVDYESLNRFGDWDRVRMVADWKNTSIKTLLTLLEKISTYTIPSSISFEFPTLLVHGTKDTVAKVTNSEILQKNIPNSQIAILPNMHHVDIVLDSKRSKIDKIILDFLKKGENEKNC